MKIICLLLVLLVPGSVMAEGVLTPAANPPVTSLYDYRSMIELHEDFLTGTTSGGSIGTTGFHGNGTITNIISESGRPGLLRVDTTTSSGTQGRINTTAYIVDPSRVTELLWIARLNTNDANTTVRVGAINNFGVSPPAEGIFFEKLDGDTNWFCVTRAAATQTRTDSGVAVSTSFATFQMNRTAAGVSFLLNGAQVCTHTTNIPTVFIAPSMFVVNSAAAAKTMDADYFRLIQRGFAR